jgi:acetyl esterase/lipase
MKERFDIVYSAEHTDRRRIDVFRPGGDASGAGIYFIHGGGFSGGSKEQWREVARHFCRAGYACASVEYRLAPDWKFPEWVADARLGMSWFKQRAAEYGFDPARVASAGSSAGGYLALILATIGPDDDLGRSDEMAVADTRPAAVVAYCPATSMHEARRWPGREAYPKLMPAPEAEDPELYRAASLEDRVRGDEPPMIFLHGDADDLIPLAESVELAARINALGGRAEVARIAGAPHGFGYGVKTDHQRAALAHAERFLKGVL